MQDSGCRDPQSRRRSENVQVLISRIAPTPSGFLHIGNAVNFLLTSWMIRENSGRLLLRIDDMDAPRCRSEYVDDIFRSLEWLGIEIDDGPSGTADFTANYSMGHKTDYYRAELDVLTGGDGTTYACTCSRKSISAHSSTGRYPGFCLDSNHSLLKHDSAMRIHVPTGTRIAVGDQAIALDETLGDFVVWRKDGLPAYQLASVIEDRDAGVNLVVRGLDLLDSSAAQLFLAPGLAADNFTRATFVHHELITSGLGDKLSKSRGAYSLRDMADTPGAKERIIDSARRVQRGLSEVGPAPGTAPNSGGQGS
jgi:glutamyl/glutaminyl-tRNA synthetase